MFECYQGMGDLLRLVGYNLDKVQQHLACHIATFGAKGEYTSKALPEVFLRIRMVMVVLEAYMV